MEDFHEEDQDELEYHITFPSPNNSTIGKSDIRYAPGSEPIVFLLGWGGCTLEALCDYGMHYSHGGCITISYCPPLKYNFLDSSELRPIAVKLLDLMGEMALENNPIIIHSFSKLGGSLYQLIIEAINKDPLKKSRLKGRIFDSNPGRPRIGSFIKFTQLILKSDPYYQGLFLYMMSLYLLLYSLLCIIKAKIMSILGGAKRQTSYFDWMMRNEENVGVPYLFMYSKDDKIVFFKDIECVIHTKTNMGCNVTKICYDSGSHINHYEMNKESYVATIMSFVYTCTSESNNQTS
uniref:CG8245 CG8245PAlike [Tribolium castaneum] n=1 Tax=Lepeophtheirus salmonis TaxID=72036 RepID=A0A0K2TUH9_LEPSM